MKLSTLKKLVDRKWKIGVILVLWVGVGVPWSYYDWPIPETKIVKVLGTRDKKLDTGSEQRRVHVYIVRKDCTIDEDADPYVLANETAWKWLKKDSENLQGKMKLWSIEVKGSIEAAPYVKISHDKWRFKWLDWYPGLIDAKRLDGCPYGVDEPEVVPAEEVAPEPSE